MRFPLCERAATQASCGHRCTPVKIGLTTFVNSARPPLLPRLTPLLSLQDAARLSYLHLYLHQQ